MMYCFRVWELYIPEFDMLRVGYFVIDPEFGK